MDIACGWGVSFAGNPEVSFYGVDVKGFPKSLAMQNGYADAREYSDENQITYENDFFDVCTVINLNAHIPFSMYADLLTQAEGKLKPGGQLLIVAELDNQGFSYAMMRAINNNRLKEMVAGMDHTNFVFEREFDKFLSSQGVVITKKSTIWGNMLPLGHYTAWAFRKDPQGVMRYPAFLIDAASSLLDNAFTTLGLGAQGRRFLVGYLGKFERWKQ